MITPGFFSFYNTHRALMTSQNALNVVNQNISNANTEGYTRQRAEITAYDPYQNPSVHAFTNGQMGQGSIVSKIERLRDSFLDAQFRNESSTLGFNEVKTQVLQQIEGIMAEPSESGISASMERFFAAAHELSLNPESIPVRQDYIQTAADFITVVQQIANQLQDLRTNLVGDPDSVGSYQFSQAQVVTTQANELLGSIAGLNKQILTVSASNAQPNDLLDKRDLLLDQLSELVDINVVQRNNGLVDVYIGKDVATPANPGLQMISGVEQIDSLEYVPNTGIGASPYDVPGFVRSVNNINIRLNEGHLATAAQGIELTGGKLKGILDMGRGGDSGSPILVNPPAGTTVRTVFEDLDRFMDFFGARVNQVQTGGLNLNGVAAGDTIFTPPAAPTGEYRQLLDWDINSAMFNNPARVAAAIDDDPAPGNQGVFAGVGDGRNALNMVALRDTAIGALSNTTFSNYLNSITSQVGIEGRTFGDRYAGQVGLVGSLDLQRNSVSGVNVDEEMIDMLRYQRAFEASSKMMAALDEIIQGIINMT